MCVCVCVCVCTTNMCTSVSFTVQSPLQLICVHFDIYSEQFDI